MESSTSLRRFIFGLAFGASVLPFAHAAPTVIQTANYGEHTYHLLSADNWFNSESAAQTLGGHLVTVEDAAENSFLVSTFENAALGLTPSSASIVSLWIGLNNVENVSNYVWSSGSSAEYRNWASLQPQNIYADERYVGIIVRDFGYPQDPTAARGYWHDIAGDDRFNNVNFGIAEIPVIPEPEIHVMLLAGLGLLSLAVGRQKTVT
ncbi:MAG TPA: lectin-like protein [Nitrosospira sp.]|nr:lectin-like protein [Nitrosospira sp.]